MKSTGEVMGISEDFGIAFAKAQAAAGFSIPTEGTVFISVNDYDKGGVLPHARELEALGFHIMATRGTADFLRAHGVTLETVYKVNEGRPNVVDLVKSGQIDIIFNTPLGRESYYDDGAIRKCATLHGVLVVTTLTATAATVRAIRALRERALDIVSLQEIHAAAAAAAGSPAVKPLYLALSGGGAHGAAHAGVLRALDREGVPVAGVAGSAAVRWWPAAWAGGADLAKLVEQAASLHPWMWVRGWGGGLLSGSKLGALIDEFLPVPTFEGLRVPVVVLATDVDTGEAVLLKEGDVREAVRASCSFPGVFPPMLLNGRRLYDGGVSEVIPVRRAREMAGEAGVVLAVDCNSGTRWPAADSLRGVALRAGSRCCAAARAASWRAPTS
jgi:predicted acylesterase/phospholipase RssA